MTMIKVCIKLHSSKIRRLEYVVAHAMRFIKLQSVFCLFSVCFDRHDKQNQNMEKTCIIYSKLPCHKKMKYIDLIVFAVLSIPEFCYGLKNKRMEGWTDDEQCNSS